MAVRIPDYLARKPPTAFLLLKIIPATWFVWLPLRLLTKEHLFRLLTKRPRQAPRTLKATVHRLPSPSPVVTLVNLVSAAGGALGLRLVVVQVAPPQHTITAEVRKGRSYRALVRAQAPISRGSSLSLLKSLLVLTRSRVGMIHGIASTHLVLFVNIRITLGRPLMLPVRTRVPIPSTKLEESRQIGAMATFTLPFIALPNPGTTARLSSLLVPLLWPRYRMILAPPSELIVVKPQFPSLVLEVVAELVAALPLPELL